MKLEHNKPEVHAKHMARALGVEHALRVATRCMNETAVNNETNIPKGTVFHKKNKYGETSLDRKYLVQLHNFWKHMVGILRKM